MWLLPANVGGIGSERGNVSSFRYQYCMNSARTYQQWTPDALGRPADGLLKPP